MSILGEDPDVTPLAVRGFPDQEVQLVYSAEGNALILRYVLRVSDGRRVVEIASGTESEGAMAHLIAQMNGLDESVEFADPLGKCAGLRLSPLVVSQIAHTPVTAGEVTRGLARMRLRAWDAIDGATDAPVHPLADELF